MALPTNLVKTDEAVLQRIIAAVRQVRDHGAGYGRVSIYIEAGTVKRWEVVLLEHVKDHSRGLDKPI